MFLNCSKFFGRHTVHNQELKNCNCSLWFYICFLVAGRCGRQPKNVCKTRGCKCKSITRNIFDCLRVKKFSCIFKILAVFVKSVQNSNIQEKMKAKALEESGPRTFRIMFNNISKNMIAICKHYIKHFMLFC